MTDYDALRAAAEAATPGPWEVCIDHHRDFDVPEVSVWAPDVSRYVTEDVLTTPGSHFAANAAYIAAASPDVVLGLLNELAAAEADYRAVSDSLDAIMDRLEAAEAKVAAVEGLATWWARIAGSGRGGYEIASGDHARLVADALRATQDAATADLTAAAPHSDQPDHHDGERGGEAGGRA